MKQKIRFNQPALRGREFDYIRQVLDVGHFAADGPFTRRTEQVLEAYFGGSRVFLTHSCTAALEIAALLTVGAGDEVILPSFTFATTGSAFARCGATLVFVDIKADTLNLDPEAVEAAITDKTRVIVAVHYAGVSCEMDVLKGIAESSNLVLVEDAAHSFGSRYRGSALGTFGDLAAVSFHETKNVLSGEGGALVVNDPRLAERAETILHRGTNRRQFMRGETDHYEWQVLGSAFGPPEIVAAFLLAQVEDVELITAERLARWHRYQEGFLELEQAGRGRRPVVPPEAQHNGHLYYLLVPDAAYRPVLLAALAQYGVQATFHYAPLHSTPAGRVYGRFAGSLAITDDVANRLVRLPLHLALTRRDQTRVIKSVFHLLNG
jgi:dTDP-4-amino-4,6-dideoxygalactose transaminase